MYICAGVLLVVVLAFLIGFYFAIRDYWQEIPGLHDVDKHGNYVRKA